MREREISHFFSEQPEDQRYQFSFIFETAVRLFVTAADFNYFLCKTSSQVFCIVCLFSFSLDEKLENE